MPASTSVGDWRRFTALSVRRRRRGLPHDAGDGSGHPRRPPAAAWTPGGGSGRYSADVPRLWRVAAPSRPSRWSPRLSTRRRSPRARRAGQRSDPPAAGGAFPTGPPELINPKRSDARSDAAPSPPYYSDRARARRAAFAAVHPGRTRSTSNWNPPLDGQEYAKCKEKAGGHSPVRRRGEFGQREWRQSAPERRSSSGR